jgi:hypothetical protein
MAWTRRGDGGKMMPGAADKTAPGKLFSATLMRTSGKRTNEMTHSAIASRAPLPAPTITPPEADRDAWLRAVAADRRLNARSRLIAMRLPLFDDDPTYDEIAAAAGCGQRTAIRAMAALIARGWIDRIASTGGVPNKFRRTMRRSE